MKPNQDLRFKIKGSGICAWQIAEYLGMHENTLFRKLRKQLTDIEKESILKALEALQKQKEIEKG